MRKFGLIGYPLGHSFSRSYFTEKFTREGIVNCSYDNYPIENIALLPKVISENKEIIGLNVTIPYKEKVFEYLDEIDPEAREIGAVNTIKVNREGDTIKLKGFNTDNYGFEQPLLEKLGKVHRSALILGTGGASKAVAYILKKHGISYRYVSRTPKNSAMYSYADLTPAIIQQTKLIVNTSPLGMHPDIERCPDIPYDALTSDHILYDLVYNPEKTLFLKKGELRNAQLLNGLPMLHLQAERAWTIWNS